MEENHSLMASYLQAQHIQNRDFDELQNKSVFGEIEERVDEVERRFNRFKNFDVLCSPPLDHYFLMHKHDYLPKQTFVENIEREWRDLVKHLANYSIFVRAYKQRFDLMRAAIIGPPGTPYHHGLFFFDIFLPRSYPSSPPKIHYHNSHGLDLNPNLRPQDGKVNLSLIEPWYERLMHGTGYYNDDNTPGKWNPKTCNIMQVLHAILRDLIISSSSSDQSIESIKYKKRAYLLTCQKMVLDLREPPKGFEEFVAGHFRKRAHPILLKFKENMDEKDPHMLDLFVILLEMLEYNGAYCKHHLDVVKRSGKILQEYRAAKEEARSSTSTRNTNALVEFKAGINRAKKNLNLLLSY